MARIRSVHPGLFTDEAFVSASAYARLLFIGLWTEACDDGVFEWKPVVLKMRLFPADTVDMDALLAELVAYDLVQHTEILGKSYGIVQRFKWLQRQEKRQHPPGWQETRLRIFARDGYACTYCGAQSARLECDHVNPVALGGADYDSNLTTACRSCNASKGAKSLEEWLSHG